MAVYRQSKQRKMIWERLVIAHEHPTAAVLYSWLRPHLPGLSLGTVYRNLGILKAQGKIRELAGNGRQSRYDADLQPHAHFYCRDCDAVFDLGLDPHAHECLNRMAPQGGLIEAMDVELKGVCPACRSMKKNKECDTDEQEH